MSKVTIKVPEQLKHPLFFPNGQISWEKEDEQILNLSRPFIYDCAFFASLNSLMPWVDGEQSISILLSEWEKLKESLRSYFSKRNKEKTASFMKQGTGLFLEFLFWANGKPVQLFPGISYNLLQIKPVNIEERLNFVIQRTNTYHSYMQLIELFNEMEKINAKSKIIHKK